MNCNPLLGDGYRIVITLSNEEPFRVDVTKQIDTSGRKSGIKIIHYGKSDVFSSPEALIYVVNTIGCGTFYENQGRSIIVSKVKPIGLRDNAIKEIQDNDGTWYVNLNAGIDQRVAKLNSLFRKLKMDWSAERVDLN